MIGTVCGSVHTSSYPDTKTTKLAAATLSAVRRYLETPGGKEALEEELKYIRKENAHEAGKDAARARG